MFQNHFCLITLENNPLADHLISSSQSLNLGGSRGTTDHIATLPLHPSLSSAALRESPNSIPVHSLRLSSQLFFCLPLLGFNSLMLFFYVSKLTFKKMTFDQMRIGEFYHISCNMLMCRLFNSVCMYVHT